MITRTKLGQTTPKIQWWNPIKLVNFGPTPTCHPSPHPDQNTPKTLFKSGFSGWSLSRGRTEVGRRFGGSRTEISTKSFMFNRRSFRKI